MMKDNKLPTKKEDTQQLSRH